MRLVLPPHRLHFASRRNLPISVVACTQQSRETGSRREVWPAKPVDRALPGDQRRRLAVPNHAIIFNQRAMQRARALFLLFRHWSSPFATAFLLPATAYTKTRICLSRFKYV